MRFVWKVLCWPMCLGALAPGLSADPSITPLTLSQSYVHDMVWDATRSRFIASSGTSIVLINPETAQVEDTIVTGPVAERIAVSGDGQYLYAAIGSVGLVRRYRIQSHTLDLEFSLGKDSQGRLLSATAMAALPGQPQSVLIARLNGGPGIDYFLFPGVGVDVAVYDGGAPRPKTLSLRITSFYVRPADGAIFGFGQGNIYQFAVGASGVAATNSWYVPLTFSKDSPPTWNGNLVSDRAGSVFDLNAGALLGRAALGQGCALAPDSTGTSLLSAQGDTTYYNAPASLVQYSLKTFLATASTSVSDSQDFFGACDFVSVIWTWGADGIAISSYQHSGGGSILVFLHASVAAGFAPVSLAPIPSPQQDASGITRLPLTVNGIVYDATRNLLWASAPGNAGQIGNCVISVDPSTGTIVDTIFAGSEPSKLALSSDASRLFAISQAAASISVIDLNAKQRAQLFSLVDQYHSTPLSIAAVPNQPDSVAVALLENDLVYSMTAAVYDHGVPRARVISNYTPGNVGNLDTYFDTLVPGDTPDALFAADLSFSHGDGTQNVFRLSIQADGIHSARHLNAIQLGGHAPVYENGFLFTGGGEEWSSDLQHLFGRFSIQQSYATIGIPAPFSDQNRIVYAYTSNLTNSGAITEFDLATERPLATLPNNSTVGGLAPAPIAAIRAGPATVAVAYANQLILAPLGNLQPWPKYSPAFQTAAPGVQRLDLPVNAIVAIPGSSKLAIATPSTDGDFGNSIVVVNPSAGQLESSVYAGSEPTLLAAAPDGSAVYATLAGERNIGRVNIASATRDLVFATDPKGGSNQYDIYDMAAGADGGLALSYYGGALAIFDNGVPRKQVDWNTQGGYAYVPATFHIAFNDSGTRLYGYNSFLSTAEFKRDAVTAQGPQFLSSAGGLIHGFGTQFSSAGNLLYTGNGDVIDPEITRIVGRLALLGTFSYGFIAPDPSTGRVFALTGQQILMFDISTRALLGSLSVPIPYQASALSLVRFGPDGLAFHTSQGQIFFLSISSIPLLPAPVPSPQPMLPATPGVTVVDLSAQDLAYDAARGGIYASVPNREASRGDQIARIDPATGNITGSWPAGTNPHLLAMSDDQSRLYWSAGAANNPLMNGYSLTSEAIRGADLSSGAIGAGFPALASSSDLSYGITAMTVLPGQPQSVAVIDNLYQNAVLPDGETILYNLGPDAFTIYDDTTPRPNHLTAHSFSCTYMVPGASASRLYCSAGGNTLTRLSVDANGVTLLDSFPLLPGRGTFGPMVFSGGRIYTTTGLVIDPEAKRTVTRVDAQGPVAVDGNTVYWLDPSASVSSAPSVVLRSYDATTLQPIATKQINVTNTDVSRLIVCGPGQLAFRAGNEIYIVTP